MKVLWMSCLLVGSISCGPMRKGSVPAAYSSDTGLWEWDNPDTGDIYVPEIASPQDSTWAFPSANPGGRAPLPSLFYPSSGKTLPASRKLSTKKSSSGSSVHPSHFLDASGSLFAASSRSGLATSGLSAGIPAASSGLDYGPFQGGLNSVASVHEALSLPSIRRQTWEYGGTDGYGDLSSEELGGPQDEDGETHEWTVEPVFSDVSGLKPVYSFSSESRYQRGRTLSSRTSYTPGNPLPPPSSPAAYNPGRSEGISSPPVSQQSKSGHAPLKRGY